MKKVLIIMMSALLCGVIAGCDEESDEPASLTQEEVVAGECGKMLECNEAMVTGMGGLDGCATTVNGIIFANCAAFDGEVAATCVDEAEAMECADFNAAVVAMSGGDPSGFPEACANMCGE